MCRIAGFWDFHHNQRYDVETTIRAMRDSLSHGGPDDAGVYAHRNIALALGHRRLSILDLSPLGHQPMSNDRGTVWITYNGEVYNFKEVREELIKKHYAFLSNSDTEVILKAYEEWGLESVQKFRGMFAFALWDENKQELILCRDRAGVKPLYWYYRDGLFLFASELKAFHKHPGFRKNLDEKALAAFLRYGYVPTPHSIFKDTHKLEAGHFLIINRTQNLKKINYWDVKDYYSRGAEQEKNGYWKGRSEEDIANELESYLRESFNLRMVSDVPVGVFLSGGIDSSAVCALLAQEGHKLKTFTIGFYEQDYNEAEYARKVAAHLGTEHTELYCTPQEAFNIIPKLPELYDEPFGDPSGIPTHLVSQLARKHVKVSLSADGGDELFCGYTRYEIVGDKIKTLTGLPFPHLISKLLDAVNPDVALALYKKLSFLFPRYTNFRDRYIKLRNVLRADSLSEQYRLANSYFTDEDLVEIGLNAGHSAELDAESLDVFHQMMLIDFKTYLPDDILVKVDRATMAIALEGREPLLDHKLVEYVAGLPAAYKYKNGIQKYILKKILYKYVPKELVDRPKQGFGMPVYEWFKNDLKNLYQEYLNHDRIKKEGIFNAAAVERLLSDYVNDKGVNAHRLWFLFVFELWREKWL